MTPHDEKVFDDLKHVIVSIRDRARDDLHRIRCESEAEIAMYAQEKSDARFDRIARIITISVSALLLAAVLWVGIYGGSK